MKHIVQKCSGSYYITDKSPLKIRESKDKNGNHDLIVFSFENDKMEALEEFFSGFYKDPSNVKKAYDNGMSKEKLLSGTKLYYACLRDTITGFLNSEIITKEESTRLLKTNKEAEKNQLKIIKNTTRFGFVKTLKREIKKSKKQMY